MNKFLNKKKLKKNKKIKKEMERILMLTISGSQTSGVISRITIEEDNPSTIDNVRMAILMDQNNTIQEKQAEIYSLKNTWPFLNFREWLYAFHAIFRYDNDFTMLNISNIFSADNI